MPLLCINIFRYNKNSYDISSTTSQETKSPFFERSNISWLASNQELELEQINQNLRDELSNEVSINRSNEKYISIWNVNIPDVRKSRYIIIN